MDIKIASVQKTWILRPRVLFSRRVVVALRRGTTPSGSPKPGREARSLEYLTPSLEKASSLTPSPLLNFPLLKRRAVWVSFLAILGFSTTAFLVFAAGPSNFLLSWDHGVQEWVVSTIPESTRANFFAGGISNLFIEFDLLCGSLMLLTHAIGNRKKGLVLTGLSALFFYAGVGSHKEEGWLVHVLKEAFHRSRPEDGMISYAFPSGHTTSAVFLTGALLFVWIPVTVKNLNSQTPPVLHRCVQGLELALQDRYVFWGISFLCTMTGRVAGNVHWLSDTIAGCFVGIALLSIFKSLYDFIDKGIK